MAPATIGGDKVIAKRRVAPAKRGVPDRCAFARIAQTPIAQASTASTSQIASHADGVAAPCASQAAASAVAPMAAPPHPGTAVKELARSIALRMKRIESSASESRAAGA